MSKIWEAFDEIFSKEQLSDEVKKRLLARLISTISQAFNQVLSEEQLSDEVKNSLLSTLTLDIESGIIEEQPNQNPLGLDDSSRPIQKGQSEKGQSQTQGRDTKVQ
ncbi:hypothetical protein [uncultured Nostoc sp.]|uniref:hypothetical protein n=1 Tax=uncultured Nostoc sp. TaxID=340711 RepID=UPI0035CB9D0D